MIDLEKRARYTGYTLLNPNKDDISKGTYCNQIPYLVWKDFGVDVRDSSGGMSVTKRELTDPVKYFV